MAISKNDAAIALYSGVLGAFLDSSADWRPTNLDIDRLSKAAAWLCANNPLLRKWTPSQIVQERSLLPSVTVTDSEERLPDALYGKICPNCNSGYCWRAAGGITVWQSK
jgi:hypothetical protein